MPTVLLAFILGFAICQIAVVCTTVFLHRALAHRSLTLSPPVRGAFRFVTWITTGIRPRQWVGVHRKHHAFTDVDGDPHSPLLLGYWKVQLGNVSLYRKAVRDGEVTTRYAKDLPPDAWDRVLFDHALLGLGLGVVVMWLIFGWEIAVIAAAFHTVTYLGVNAAVNAVGHLYGRKVYDNTARNSQWLAWLTAGEGLHNNHHAAPTSARLSLGRGEIDPGWWVIRALVGTGQATIRLSEVRFARPRPDRTFDGSASPSPRELGAPDESDEQSAGELTKAR
ncbi:MAG: fatty acid desaturase [Acidimicrobiales bacterium]